MSYEAVWACIAARHGWDIYSDDPAEHWDEIDDEDKGRLEYAFHAQV